LKSRSWLSTVFATTGGDAWLLSRDCRSNRLRDERNELSFGIRVVE
jgi:hypothetical protein